MNLTINIENGVVSLFSQKDVKQLKEIKERLDRMEAKLGAIQQSLTPMRYIPAISSAPSAKSPRAPTRSTSKFRMKKNEYS